MGNTFVLVHGAWHGGWCWEKLRPLLEAEGHTVIAPDMPGHGEDRLPIEDQNLEKYARTVEALIAPLNEPVILVGHSFGGMITSQAACYIPNKIKNLSILQRFYHETVKAASGSPKAYNQHFMKNLWHPAMILYCLRMERHQRSRQIPVLTLFIMIFPEM